MTAMAFFFEMLQNRTHMFSMFENLGISRMGKWGISTISNSGKWNTWKMKSIDCGAFRGKMQMLSHGEVLFRMRLGAFYGTSCNNSDIIKFY